MSNEASAAAPLQAARVLVIDDDWHMRGLITVMDILKSTEHPLANKDSLGRLRAGAAVGVGAGTEERVELLAEAGVDVIVVDTAHGHSQGVLDRVKWVKKNYPQIEVIGGKTGFISSSGYCRLHLYDAYRCGCWCAANHGHPECVRFAKGVGRADDC